MQGSSYDTPAINSAGAAMNIAGEFTKFKN
jgi:hypothetical protein